MLCCLEADNHTGQTAAKPNGHNHPGSFGLYVREIRQASNPPKKQGTYPNTSSLPDIRGWTSAMDTVTTHNAKSCASGRLRNTTNKTGSATYICTSSGSVHGPPTI